MSDTEENEAEDGGRTTKLEEELNICGIEKGGYSRVDVQCMHGSVVILVISNRLHVN